MKRKTLYYLLGSVLLSSVFLTGCQSYPDKNPKEGEHQVEKKSQKTVVISLKGFEQKWDENAKLNAFSSYKELSKREQAKGITFFSTGTKDEKEWKMFQAIVDPSILNEKEQVKAVNAIAKSLSPSMKEDALLEWQDAFNRAKKVDLSSKKLLMPMLKIGDTHQAVFLKMPPAKENTKVNRLMIQVEPIL